MKIETKGLTGSSSTEVEDLAIIPKVKGLIQPFAAGIGRVIIANFYRNLKPDEDRDKRSDW